MPTNNCSRCGLPMSYADQPPDEAPHWVCDGPNDNTRSIGCGESCLAHPDPED